MARPQHFVNYFIVLCGNQFAPRSVWVLVLMGICGLAWGQPAKTERVTCITCHETEAAEFARSVHAAAEVSCHTCHGGEKRYSVETSEIERLRRVAVQPAGPERTKKAEIFSHGPDFQKKGKPARKDIPERCGNCHSDVLLMNPYGLPTDQLAQYRTSGHGRALYGKNDHRVAVCTDCHGTHEVLRVGDTANPVHPLNVPATCGRCHSDPVIMIESQLSTNVIAEYRQSVHGRGLLEDGDVGMPTCSSCHGSHSAVPPGYGDVGHVCGRCHQQEEQYFLKSPHAKFPLFPRCVGCHTASHEAHDHRIFRMVSSPESTRKTYQQVAEMLPAASLEDPRLQEAFEARREPNIRHFETICQRCHVSSAQSHRVFFKELDKEVVKEGAELYKLVRDAELRYAATASRVDQVGRGVILVTDEALMVDEIRTQLVALGPMQHALNYEELRKAKEEMDAAAAEINQNLDEKTKNLNWRFKALVPMWIFVIFFSGVLWIKYKRLKAALVIPMAE